ncbi:MAG: hypothetical protein AB1938_06320 [Myxococcota bacterium]
MFSPDVTPTEKVFALRLPAEEPLATLKLARGEALRDERGLFHGFYALRGTLGGRPVELHLDERNSTITLVDGLRVRELSARELAALRRRVQAWLQESPVADFAASTFLVHLNELVFGRPVLAHFEPTVASERPGEGLKLAGRVGKASLELTLTRGGRLTLSWRPRGCDTSRSRRLTADETAALVQVLGSRIHGQPRTLLQEAMVRLWEAARRELH